MQFKWIQEPSNQYVAFTTFTRVYKIGHPSFSKSKPKLPWHLWWRHKELNVALVPRLLSGMCSKLYQTLITLSVPTSSESSTIRFSDKYSLGAVPMDSLKAHHPKGILQHAKAVTLAAAAKGPCWTDLEKDIVGCQLFRDHIPWGKKNLKIWAGDNERMVNVHSKDVCIQI